MKHILYMVRSIIVIISRVIINKLGKKLLAYLVKKLFNQENFDRVFFIKMCSLFFFQNVLTMTAINSNYADPNNLMFEEIKILGSLQEITKVTVSQNNVVENSPHNIIYYPSEKVTQ